MSVWIGGIHAVNQALAAGKVCQLVVLEGKMTAKRAAVVAAGEALGLVVERRPSHHFDLTLPGVRHQGVMAELERAPETARSWQDALLGVAEPLVLVLDCIQDPHNLGACLRTAAAAGVHAVIIPNARAASLNATACKVACGGAELVPVFAVPNLRRCLDELRAMGIWVVGAAGEATQALYDLNLRGPLAVVVGNEEQGLRAHVREGCDFLAAIPMENAMESLNVSVATGVLLFEVKRQRSQK